MLKKYAKKHFGFGVFFLGLIGMMISCEKDFQDVNSSVITNSEFATHDTILDVVITNKKIDYVRADGLVFGGLLGQYLLGVYNNQNYEKIEASIVSQLTIDPSKKLVTDSEMNDKESNSAVTVIDSVFLKLPYQASLKANTTSDFTLDSIIGDPTKAFTLNVYESDTFLNELNPADPTKTNSYYSNASYLKAGTPINSPIDFQFKPNALDTVIYISRRAIDGVVYEIDTVSLQNKTPFARVPLNKNFFQQRFIDEFSGNAFSSQDAFNEYFKGLIVEASGENGSLISFNFANSATELKPSVEIYYSSTLYKDNVVTDTLAKSLSFPLASISNSIYKMEDKTYADNGNIVLQGAAGSMADIQLFGPDNDNNSIADQLEELRSKGWLINDAQLTLHVNQQVVGYDTIASPYRLFLFKNDPNTQPSQIKDMTSEGIAVYGGQLTLSDKKPDSYTFRITDYISDLFGSTSSYNPPLGLRIFNSTDVPSSTVQNDTLVKEYQWNPKVTTLLNHELSHGARRAQLKISYSKKTN